MFLLITLYSSVNDLFNRYQDWDISWQHDMIVCSYWMICHETCSYSIMFDSITHSFSHYHFILISSLLPFFSSLINNQLEFKVSIQSHRICIQIIEWETNSNLKSFLWSLSYNRIYTDSYTYWVFISFIRGITCQFTFSSLNYQLNQNKKQIRS